MQRVHLFFNLENVQAEAIRDSTYKTSFSEPISLDLHATAIVRLIILLTDQIIITRSDLAQEFTQSSITAQLWHRRSICTY